MLSVLLLILKIIGIILLVILGIVVLVLFVPVFYKGDVHYSDEEFVKHFSAHWLFFPVRFKFSYEDGEMEKSLRIFGFNIFREKKEEPKKEYEKPFAEISYENEFELRARYANQDDEMIIDITEDTDEFSDKEMLDPKFTSVDYPDAEIPDIKSIDTGIKDSRWTKIKKKFKKEKKLEKAKVRVPLSRRIKKAAFKTKSRTLIAIAESVKAVEGAMKKLQVGFMKVKEYIDFINRKSTRRAFKKIRNIATRVIKHIFPNKIYGKNEFGLSEPHLTGQALGGVAIAYDMFDIDPEKVETIPHFEKEMIDARLDYKGHVIVAVLAYYFAKFMLDPDIRKTMKFINKQKDD